MLSLRRPILTLVMASVCTAGRMAMGATVTVNPTGQFPGDQQAVQTAINNAQPGDTIVLGTGTFNLTGLQDLTPAVVVTVPNLTIVGAANEATVLEGPGLSLRSSGIIVGPGGSGLTVQGLHIENFVYGVQALPDVNNLAVIDCQFDQIARAVLGQNHGEHVGWRIIGNDVTAPPLAVVKGLSDEGNSFLGFTLPCAVDATITDNQLTGPGIDPAMANSDYITSSALGMHDPSGCSVTARGGLVARNQVTDFGAGLESAASGIVFDANTVTGCRIGIGVGTVDPTDPPTIGVDVVNNHAAGNTEFGVMLAGAQETLVLGNDLQHNGEGAIGVEPGYLASPPIPSLDNTFRNNTDNQVVPLQGDPATAVYSPAHGQS